MKWSESKRYRRITYFLSAFGPMLAAFMIATAKGERRYLIDDLDEADFWFPYLGFSFFVFLVFRFLPSAIESPRKFLRKLSNHQGYKRLSIFVPCVVFVMVWINLKIEEGQIDTGDFVWISGFSALFAALSFVAVKGVHWVTDGFKSETKDSQERSKGE